MGFLGTQCWSLEQGLGVSPLMLSLAVGRLWKTFQPLHPQAGCLASETAGGLGTKGAGPLLGRTEPLWELPVAQNHLLGVTGERQAPPEGGPGLFPRHLA